MPKNFTITVKGVELQCKPLRLSHALIVSKIGNVFQAPKDFNSKEIKQAEIDLDDVLTDLIPELKGISLGINDTVELITQLMDNVQPTDDKEVKDAGVRFDTDPKVTIPVTETIG